MKRVLIVFPTAWDRRQLAAAGLERQYDVVFAGPDDDECPARFDVLGFIERTCAEHGGSIDGVSSSSDYPGAAVAAAIATRLGLPGSRPEAILGCTHKYASRLVQARAVPEATPAFWLVDPRRPLGGLSPGHLPCFVKPVRGSFSMLASRMESGAALQAYLDHSSVATYLDEYVLVFNALVASFSELELDGGWFIAEELLSGRQATVEGFVRQGEVGLLGVVDSIVRPGTGSFVRFDYPSALSADVQGRMVDVAGRVALASGLQDVLFNVELMHDERTDRVSVLEINPRMCGQFADLYEKVDGRNGYAVALALATGSELPPVTGPAVAGAPGAHARGTGALPAHAWGMGARGAGAPADEARVAASFPLRVFEPVRVERAPSAADLRAAEALFPGTLAWSEVATGDLLADFTSGEDGASARYGIVNLGARDREELVARAQVVTERLGFRFAPAKG